MKEDESDGSKKHRATVRERWCAVVCLGCPTATPRQLTCVLWRLAAWSVQVEEECPECKNPRMSFYTMQMRSVDEGQTVFYECEKCGYTFSTNT